MRDGWVFADDESLMDMPGSGWDGDEDNEDWEDDLDWDDDEDDLEEGEWEEDDDEEWEEFEDEFDEEELPGKRTAKPEHWN